MPRRVFVPRDAPTLSIFGPIVHARTRRMTMVSGAGPADDRCTRSVRASDSENLVTSASIVQPRSRSRAGVSPLAKLGVAVVAVAAGLVFAAAAVVLLSTLFSFQVAVPIQDGGAMGGSSSPLWWLDAIGAFLCGAVAVAAVVEAVRIARSPD
jgi:hypothetical protein